MSESTILWNDDELWIDSQLWDAVGTDFYISTASIALLGIAPEYLVETVFDCPSAELHVTAVAPELVDAVFSVPTAAITIQAGDVSLQLVYGVATATIAVAGVDAELIFSSFNVETAEITVAGVAATFAVDAFDVATAEITVAGIDADFLNFTLQRMSVGVVLRLDISAAGLDVMLLPPASTSDNDVWGATIEAGPAAGRKVRFDLDQRAGSSAVETLQLTNRDATATFQQIGGRIKQMIPTGGV